MPPSLKRAPSTADKSVSPPPTKRRLLSTVDTTTTAAIQITTTSTTSKTVSNFFKPASERAPSKLTWRTINETLLAASYDKEDNHKNTRPRKVAAFDFDSTLTSTKSGKKFSKEATDWKWWHPSVEPRLRSLAADGYLVCIFSNQGGLSLVNDISKTSKAEAEKVSRWKQKVRYAFEQLDLPLCLYAATGYDGYRKPRPGMWRQLVRDAFAGDEGAIDIEGSFFVGDAGGRIEGDERLKRDFSCSDRDFAANAGITFLTPEEFFLSAAPRPYRRVFEPQSYLSGMTAAPTNPTAPLYTRRNNQDIVLLVGSPGAGKSTFFWTALQPLGYARVNQDTLKTRDACVAAATALLGAGTSVAVDNTNASIDTRGVWIALASRTGLPIRCVQFTAGAKLCEHNAAVRAMADGATQQGQKFNPEARTLLPKVAFTSYAARYQPPDLREGFQDVVQVGFRFEGSEDEKKVWGQHWVSS